MAYEVFYEVFAENKNIVDIIRDSDLLQSYYETILNKFPDDQEIALAICSKECTSLSRLSRHLLGDKEFMLKVVSQYGRALKFASPDLQNNEEMVLVAVKQNPSAFLFIKDKSLEKQIKETVVNLKYKFSKFLIIFRILLACKALFGIYFSSTSALFWLYLTSFCIWYKNPYLDVTKLSF